MQVFGSKGSERNFSDTITNIFDYERPQERVIAISGNRDTAWFRDQLSLKGELMLRQPLRPRELSRVRPRVLRALAGFPLERVCRHHGGGPLGAERHDDLSDRSRLLNRFNLELTGAMPHHPDTSLMVRLQHRSGIFGLINGVTDASNFLPFGVRHEL
ncbi:MAG: hypothetical protein GDA49_10590 [Rhodospirillales bacterium]|nr:hypothetical protein [Rhodospirillales bacterium]